MPNDTNVVSANAARKRFEDEYQRLVKAGDYAPKLSTRLASRKQAVYLRTLIDNAFRL